MNKSKIFVLLHPNYFLLLRRPSNNNKASSLVRNIFRRKRKKKIREILGKRRGEELLLGNKILNRLIPGNNQTKFWIMRSNRLKQEKIKMEMMMVMMKEKEILI